MTSRIPAFLLGLAVNCAVGQTVNFNNNVLTFPPDRLIRFPGSGAPVVGTNFVAVLLYGTSDDSLVAHTATARFRVPTTTLPGTWQGGTRTLTGVPGTPGLNVRLQVAVFDNAQFPNYAAALAGGGILGRSIAFDYTLPPQPPPPGSDSMVNFSSFIAIPEPTIIGLAALGLVTLWIANRRRS